MMPSDILFVPNNKARSHYPEGYRLYDLPCQWSY